MAFHTLVELYRETFDHHPRPDAFRHKIGGRWVDVSSAEARAIIESLAAALAHRGVAPGDRIIILSENRLEWALADYGILTARAVTVPIYPTLAPAGMSHILADCGARIAIVSTAEQLEKIRELAGHAARGGHPTPLQTVVMLDPLPGGPGISGERINGYELMSWDALINEGRHVKFEDPGLVARLGSAVQPDDLATLIYTSGTTGTPKGVMLTHANLCSNVHDALLDFDISPSDSALSLLPLSHIFERMAGHYTMLARGVSIAYAESIDAVAANLLEIRPTICFAVPRLFEKIYRRILDAAMAASPLQRAIFFRARTVAWAWTRATAARRKPAAGLVLEHRLYDRLVYHRLRERVGGRMRFFVSGGAPLNPEIAGFFCGAGIQVIEGYGLTETSPVLAVNRPDHNKPGTVGRPIANVQVRIAADGEIVVRSPGVMRGYFNLPDETRAVLSDGWFHTGDIGHLDADGHLVITDRKKDLLVTAGGKNVAPQPIENALKTIPYVAEAVLIGDRRPYCAALIVPNFQQLEAWARYKLVPFPNRAELLARPEVLDLYRRRIEAATTGFARYEQVKKFTLLDRDLTVEAGELTPTLKVRRRVVNERFADAIEAMYQDGGEGLPATSPQDQETGGAT